MNQRLALGATTPVESRVEAGAELHAIMLPSGLNDASVAMTVRLADCDGQRNSANMLLSRMYDWRGYGARHKVPVDPNCVTFTASTEMSTIGTLTLTVDSAAGLAVDQTFRDEVEPFRRAPGAKLCELTRFAFDSSAPARPRLAALFHIIFIYGSMHYGCTDLMIEVNPRHRRFYEAMLGFKAVGDPRNNAAVDAPSQLMWLNVGAIRRYIDQQGAGKADGRSLYPHFFSAAEEQGIYGRLLSLRQQAGTDQLHMRSNEAATPSRLWLLLSPLLRRGPARTKPLFALSKMHRVPQSLRQAVMHLTAIRSPDRPLAAPRLARPER